MSFLTAISSVLFRLLAYSASHSRKLDVIQRKLICSRPRLPPLDPRPSSVSRESAAASCRARSLVGRETDDLLTERILFRFSSCCR